ncbi:Hypothetical Protein MfeM64YM_0024 [Mycoplasmopsis fermentans M64]|uniref:Uncharacterized protein n=1 Tax=Mycoplasmopsis fermentans (strain M64) TaxID=943945 RepID=A0AB32XAB3_MYCFM|nr:Hypothetical Protein MfeM64YM_0024 [Mycoplasmopsis fermentans M64]
MWKIYKKYVFSSDFYHLKNTKITLLSIFKHNLNMQ